MGAVHSVDAAAEAGSEVDIAVAEGEESSQEVASQGDCQLPVDTTDSSTDVYWGEIWLTDDGEPLSLYSWEYRSYPSLLTQRKLDEDSHILTFDLLDNSGEIVKSVLGSAVEQQQFQEFGILGEVVPKLHRYAQFRVEIPDPPEYDDIAILYADELVGNISRSENAPEIEIISPECGSVFEDDNIVRMIWGAYDLDVVDLTHEVWYSKDGGISYKKTELESDNTFRKGEFSGTNGVFVRLYISDGSRVSFDETYFLLTVSETKTVTTSTTETLENNNMCSNSNSADSAEFSSIKSRHDIITGVFSLSDKDMPLRLESLNIESYPNNYTSSTIKPFFENSPHFGQHLDFPEGSFYREYYRYLRSPIDSYSFIDTLNIKLLDSQNRVLRIYPIMQSAMATVSSLYPYHANLFFDHEGYLSRFGSFIVRVPHAPEYAKIEIYTNTDKLLVEVWRSGSDPSVKIWSPQPGSTLCYEDIDSLDEQLRNKFSVSWSAFDPDDDDILEKTYWISTDGGERYKYTDLDTDRNLFLNDIYHALKETGEATRIYLRIYVSDGRRTAFDETYFDLKKIKPELKPETQRVIQSPFPEDAVHGIGNQTKCHLPIRNLPESAEAYNSTDEISAELHLAYINLEYQVISAANIKIRSEPGMIYPDDINEIDESLPYPVVVAELLDSDGKVVHRVSDQYQPGVYRSGPPRSVRPNGLLLPRRDSLWYYFPIPNPPDYDSVVLLHEGREVGYLERSANAPTIQIDNQECNRTYSPHDLIRLIYTAYDFDGDQISIFSQFSLDEGVTYYYFWHHCHFDIKQGVLKFVPQYLLGGERNLDTVLVRLHATDGTRSSFDEINIQLDAEQSSSSSADLTEINQPGCAVRSKSSEPESTDSPDVSTTDSTHVIFGEIHFSDDGNPLRLESLVIKTYPGIWEPLPLRKNYKELRLALLTNNRIRTKREVYSTKFTVLPSRKTKFVVRIPNPPEYDKIELYDSEQIIETVPRNLSINSPDNPAIELRKTTYDGIFNYNEVIHNPSDYIGLYLNPETLAGHPIEDLWISTDGGKTYKMTSLIQGKYLHPSDLHNASTISLRIYKTNGRRTNYREINYKLIRSPKDER